MEKTTINTFLYHAKTAAGPFTKLIDITSYPDIFTAPEKLDISDMSSKQKKYTPGMTDLADYEFGFNYTKAGYDACKALEGSEEFYQIRFGKDGEFGAWQWQGDVFVTPSAGSVGATRTGKIVFYPSTEVTTATITSGN